MSVIFYGIIVWALANVAVIALFAAYGRRRHLLLASDRQRRTVTVLYEDADRGGEMPRLASHAPSPN